jgi:hypothetical protein
MKVSIIARICLAFPTFVGIELSDSRPAAAGEPNAKPVWTQFEMNRKNADGDYLWTDPENWNRGVPGANLSVEIGDDHSGQALHCVIPSGAKAVCQHLELAEHGKTQGTTLRLEEGASFTIQESAVLSKDRESWFYVGGVFRCVKPRGGLRVGGPWGRPELGEPAACHLLVGPTGTVDAWFLGINTSWRSDSAPSSPWGPRFFARSTDSVVVVDGGRLLVQEGLRISTSDSGRPGALRLKGKATFHCPANSDFGVDVWCGTWEIDGGDAKIDVGDIEFWGNKFKDAVNTQTDKWVGSGTAVLKLTGTGISTIRARSVDFVDAAVLDVSSLDVAPGTYTVIDGKTIARTDLQFAKGTSAANWDLRFDQARGDLVLSFSP